MDDANRLTVSDLEAAKNWHRAGEKECSPSKTANRMFGIAATCIGIVEELLKLDPECVSSGDWTVKTDNGMSTTICDGDGMFIAEDECFSVIDAKHIVDLHNIWRKAVKGLGWKMFEPVGGAK